MNLIDSTSDGDFYTIKDKNKVVKNTVKEYTENRICFKIEIKKNSWEE